MTRLDDAMRSLREDVSGASPNAQATLTRILQARRAKPSRTRVRLVALLAATFLLVGGGAWAAFARYQHPRSLLRTGVEAPPPPTLERAVARVTPPPVLPSERTLEPEVSDVAPLPSGTATTGRTVLVLPSAKATAAPAELEAYERAHRAQFDERDASRALGLWNDFLRRYPASRWDSDVRYNRALCLVRLHRVEEARRALEPFARGGSGYRQTEAVALLAALADAGP